MRRDREDREKAREREGDEGNENREVWGRRGREADKTRRREMEWGARQRSRQRDRALKKGETVRPRKDRAAALAYQLFHKTSALISINSNDKCGLLWQRLINSQRGKLSIVRIQIIQCHRLEQVLRGSVVNLIVFWNYYSCLTCLEKVRPFILSV